MSHNHKLDQKKIAILTCEGFEKSELFEPMHALKSHGATVDVVSPEASGAALKSWDKTNWGQEVTVDKTVADTNFEDYDALLLPGGVINPDKLRRDEKSVNFIKNFAQTGKPIAAICHGPQTLIEADAVKGKQMTSYASIKTDLKNAGASWQDQELVVDNGLITSRSPEDLPAFNKKLLEELCENKH